MRFVYTTTAAIWLAMPTGAALSQSLPEAPLDALEVEIKRSAERDDRDPSQRQDSQRHDAAATRIAPPEPPDRPKPRPGSKPAQEHDDGAPRKPSDTEERDTTRGDDRRNNDTSDDSVAEREDDDAVDRDDGGPASPGRGEPSTFGSRTPVARDEPSARELARQGGGSLLDRPPAGFDQLDTARDSLTDRPAVTGADHDPCELLVVSPSMADARSVRGRLVEMNIEIRRRYDLPHLGFVLSVFCTSRVGPAAQVADALEQGVLPLRVALNDRYQPAGRDYYVKAIGWRDELRVCGARRRIGLVDTGVDVRHGALANARVTTRSLLSPGVRPASREHGTAVASVLAGTSGEAPGLIGEAELLVADVFRQRGNDESDTNAELLVRALDWLVGRDVELINMSLAGPHNEVLARAVEAAAAVGAVMVAAGGNGDRNPVFPAAYPNVVAVTAVDARTRVYSRANRGGYIDFAAPGVDLYLAAPGNRGKYYTGTSFATPFVTAALAILKTSHPDADAGTLFEVLASGAVDLGEAGRDPTFGRGLIQAPPDCNSLAVRR